MRIKHTCALLCLFFAANAVYGARLAIDTDYRVRGLAYSNLDYLESTNDRSNYYSQRLNLTISNSPNENMDLIAKIQAIGVAGRSDLDNTRYPNANFEPFIENAYFKLKNIAQQPLNLSVGRQPFWYGSGLLMADDGLGYFGIKTDYTLPWKDIRIDLFTAKESESQSTSGDSDIYGLIGTLPGRINTWQLGLYYEKNTSSGIVINGDPVLSDKKIFIDLLLEGNMEGAFYNAEIIMQRGSVDKEDPNLPDPTYNSLSYLFEGGYYGFSNTMGRVEVKFTYGEGKGDNQGTEDKIEAFSPGFGHKYDGLERTGYGDFYAATLYDCFQGLQPGYSGIQVIGLGGNIAPFSKMNFDIDYFLFKAKSAPAGAPKDLGAELDLKASYIYSKFLDFNASVALFFPGDGTQIDGSRARRLKLETNVRF